MRISDWSSDVCSSDLGVMEMVDVELLAKAIAWAADAPNARNRTFNVENGDTYIWPDLWPVIASEIGIATGGDRKSGVEGKRVTVRVDLGGRRISIKNNSTKTCSKTAKVETN